MGTQEFNSFLGELSMGLFQSNIAAAEKRETRAAHVLAGFAAIGLLILLNVSIHFVLDHETGVRVVGWIGFVWLLLAIREQIYQLGDLMEQRFGRFGSPSSSDSTSVKKPAREDWPAIGVYVAAILMLRMLLEIAPQGIKPWETSSQTQMEQQSPDSQSHSRQATLGYWQATVASLHHLRFDTPTGEEPAEQYYERTFQQLRQQVAAARAAATNNVDTDLVQLGTGHLLVDNQCLEIKEKLDVYMQEQQLPTPTDTIDQRMNLARLLFGTVELNPQVLADLPPGPERDWLEQGLELEQRRQEMFREIEIMQAVLQERYRGTAFPLPAIH